MITFSLPETAEFSGRDWRLRTDFRAVLKVCVAMNDPELSEYEKAVVILQIMYPDWEKITDPQRAIDAAMEFINLGQPVTESHHGPVLMDWEQDFNIIAPAIDKVLGYSCRRCRYLHWWEFYGAYMEIDEGLYATVVGIRKKKSKGKKLEKYEQEFARNNASLINLKPRMTEEEKAFWEELMRPD